MATKEYADNVRGGGWINRKQDGTYAIKRDLDIDGKKLKNIPPPIEDADAVNKIYADTLSDETKRYVNSVTPFVNQQNQYVATNNINMRDFTLQNVGEPTNDKDVATKGYVDNSGGGAFEARNGGYNAKGPLYIGGHKIGGVKDPEKGGEATNKRYVDNYVEKYVNSYVEKFKDGNGFFTLPWDINMAGKKLSGLYFPSKSDEAATREYVDKVGNDVREYTDRSSELLGERFKRLQFAFLKDNGKFVAYTPISMASQPLKDLTEPKETSDAATKKYVDDLIGDNVGVGNMNGGGSPFFKENGNYQASHAINMAFKKLLNLSTPSELFEAATKDYVDNSITKGIETRYTIAATASYHGDLIKGNYQFTFGGSSVKSYKKHDVYNGFLMPHNGYIKRFVMEVPGLKFSSDTYTNLIDFKRSLEDVSIHVFTLVSVDRFNLVSDLGAFVIDFKFDGKRLHNRHWFNPIAPLENLRLFEGYILNIRSEINTANLSERYKYVEGGRDNIDSYFPIDDIVNEFYAYLTTILIELDPL